MTRLDPWDAAAQARVSDRWAAASAEWNTAITQALLTATGLSPDSMVLDLAAGSGEPALSIARRLTAGKVIAIDSSLASLLLAKTHARELGLESKVECLQGDAQAIPIRHDCVDRITCRFGIMFMSNTARAMSEMMRVLKPGGRVALLAWGPLNNRSSTPPLELSFAWFRVPGYRPKRRQCFDSPHPAHSYRSCELLAS